MYPHEMDRHETIKELKQIMRWVSTCPAVTAGIEIGIDSCIFMEGKDGKCPIKLLWQWDIL